MDEKQRRAGRDLDPVRDVVLSKRTEKLFALLDTKQTDCSEFYPMQMHSM